MFGRAMRCSLLVGGAALTTNVLSAVAPLGAQGRGAAPAVVIPPEGPAKGTIPRLPNGKPDFSGTFDHPRVGDITKPANGCAGGTPGCASVSDTAEISFTPAGAAEQKKEPKFDYGLFCLPWGYTRSTMLGPTPATGCAAMILSPACSIETRSVRVGSFLSKIE